MISRSGFGFSCLNYLFLLTCLVIVPAATAEEVAFVQAVEDGVNGVEGLGGARFIAVSPDGANVYATGEGDSSIAVFMRDGAGGALAFVEQETDGIGGVDGIEGADTAVVSPDGAHVYVTGAFESGLAAFARTPATGELTFLSALFDGMGGVSGMSSPVGMAISPDGAHLYVSGFGSSSVAVFARNAVSGLLTFVEAQFDGMGGVNGLGGAFGLEVSPDGAHLYVAGFTDGAVAVFTRSPVTGGLSFVQALTGDTGLLFARDVAVSSDGSHVYTAGFGDSAIGVFGRSAGTGELTFVEAQVQGVGGVTGLLRPASTAVSANGQEVYAVDGMGNALAVFDRDPGTGMLSFVEVELDNMDGVNGLAAPLWVTVSPDSDHVYVASSVDNAVAVFFTGIFADGFESGDLSAWSSVSRTALRPRG